MNDDGNLAGELPVAKVRQFVPPESEIYGDALSFDRPALVRISLPLNVWAPTTRTWQDKFQS